jgi:hypothetical protein
MGALTVGADDISNVLLISCKEELFHGVVEMVRKLDEESAPKMTVIVHPVEGSVRAQALQQAITETVGRPWLGGRPEDASARGGRGAQPPQNGENSNQRPQGGNRGRNQRGGGPQR